MTNGYKITKLDNGIHILTENIPYVKSFSVGFWFDTGSKNETRQTNGLSHFIEHMLFKGTGKRTARKIADEIESLGGYLNAFTSKEHTCYYGRGLSQYIGKTFEVMADMILDSKFRERDIKNEAGVIIDELHDIEDSPEELIFDKFEGNIYKGNYLHWPIIGTQDNILSFNKESIEEYLAKHYGNRNMYISASGAVKHENIVKLAQKYFGERENTRKSKPRSFKLLPSADTIHYKEVQQVHAIYGKPVAGYKDNKRNAMNILSHILGDGSSSRLFQALRERNGITYQINTFLNSFFNISSFGIYFSTNPKNFGKAQKLVENELEKFYTKPLSKKEVERAKAYIKGNMLMGLENTTNRMMRMAQSFIYFNRIKTIEETIAEIDALTIEDLKDLSQEMFLPGTFTKAAIIPENQ